MYDDAASGKFLHVLGECVWVGRDLRVGLAIGFQKCVRRTSGGAATKLTNT